MRGIHIFPNLFTAANLAFGFSAIALMTVNEPANLVMAGWLIIFANVFDAMDGRVARLLKTSSQFGEEFDSLADLVSFGVAPAVLMLKISLWSYGNWGLAAALLFVLGGAARLARFNVLARTPKPPSYFFVGCPIPAASTLVVSCALYDLTNAIVLPNAVYLALTLCAAVLMVSTLPYPSMKKSHGSPQGVYVKGLVLVMMLVASFTYKQDFIFLVAACYMSSGILWKIGRDLARLTGFVFRRRKGVAADQPGH